MDQRWKQLSKRKTRNLLQVRCNYAVKYLILKLTHSSISDALNSFYPILEPIIKPVRHRQFTLMEQELPATVYDME